MKTRIKARKNTVIRWIEEKFGSLEMLAGLTGIDTTHREVRNLLKQVRTSREPVVLSIRWKSSVIEVHIEHSSSAPVRIGPGDYSIPVDHSENDSIDTDRYADDGR